MTQTPPKPVDMAALTNQLQAARSHYIDAFDNNNKAASRLTQAMNTLNAAQRDFDNGVASLRKDMPVGSDWGKLGDGGAVQRVPGGLGT